MRERLSGKVVVVFVAAGDSRIEAANVDLGVVENACSAIALTECEQRVVVQRRFRKFSV